MMDGMKGAPTKTRPRFAILIVAGMGVLVSGSGGPLTGELRGWPLVGTAAAQQVDRVVPPAAIAGRMAPVDETFALFFASSSLAQIEGARVVLKTTKSADMTDFAQRIVRDHTEALDRLRRIAAQSGLDLPPAVTGRHADLVTKLTGVAPAERDDAFIRRFGIDAHKELIALTERHVKDGRDPELKRYAGEALETLREHMTAARRLAYAASAR